MVELYLHSSMLDKLYVYLSIFFWKKNGRI
jgi:hypothetical protein